jgi:hypothetical protein
MIGVEAPDAGVVAGADDAKTSNTVASRRMWVQVKAT